MKILTKKAEKALIEKERRICLNEASIRFNQANANFDKQLLELTDKLSASEKHRAFIQQQYEDAIRSRLPALRPRTLTPQQLNQFFQCDETLPLWRAVMETVHDYIQYAVTQVSSPTLEGNPDARAHCAGGLDWVIALRDELVARRETACQNETDDKKED
jgi:hypothetical protein